MTMTPHMRNYDGRGCAAPRPSHFQIAQHDTRMATARIDLPPGVPITIPVNWFHVTDGVNGAVSADMRQAQINVLNTAYAPARIQFETAEVITLDNPAWFIMSPGSAEERQARKVCKFPGRLVIMTVGRDGSMAAAIGWSSFPWQKVGDPDMDGVTLYHGVLPGGEHPRQNLGMTAVHEVGHWLGLFHTFQGGCAATGDHVGDTPPQARPNVGIPVVWQGCGDRPGPIGNFMDYCDDAAMHEFSSGQCDRMRRTVAAYRSELLP